MNKRKYRIELEETVRYRRSAIVETDLSEDVFNSLLDVAQRSDHPDDVEMKLENRGVKVIIKFSNSYSSPFDSEIEIDDYEEV